MRQVKCRIGTVFTAMVLVSMLTMQPGSVAADMADNPSLIISQFKVTSRDGQFITLYNATDSILDMSRYRLEYFNSYDLEEATSSKLLALSGTVPPHGYYMINDDALLLCRRMMIDSVPLGLSSTAGMIQIVSVDQAVPGGSAASVLQDYVGWSKKQADGAQTLPAESGYLLRQPLNADGAPRVTTPGGGKWQAVRPADDNPCLLTSMDQPGAIISAATDELLPSIEPPAKIVEADSGVTSDLPVIPAADVGLRVPSITELLPNPEGTGNDSTDEFIELYNPNAADFDLSGFILQSGTTRLHKFKFPKGTKLSGKTFKAFYSKTTGLSLSNSVGQAKLLDPFGNAISSTAVYAKAKDGVSWVLAKGKWYWSSTVTPGQANIVKLPPSSKAASKHTASSKGSSGSASVAGGSAVDAADASDDAVASNPIRTRTLVLVIALALLYGAYEYRTDMANGIHRLRRNLGNWHEDRA